MAPLARFDVASIAAFSGSTIAVHALISRRSFKSSWALTGPERSRGGSGRSAGGFGGARGSAGDRDYHSNWDNRRASGRLDVRALTDPVAPRGVPKDLLTWAETIDLATTGRHRRVLASSTSTTTAAWSRLFNENATRGMRQAP